MSISDIMDAYILPAQISSTVIMILGTVIHSLVIYLTIKKRTADIVAYTLFMRIYSAINILRFICGWILTTRLVGASPDGVAYVYYGPGTVLGPRFCNVLDSLFHSPVRHGLSDMVPVGMALRAVIVFGLKLKSRHVVAVVLLVFSLDVPTAVLMIQSYCPISQCLQLVSTENLDHVSRFSAWAMVPPFRLETWYITNIAQNHSYVCVPLTFILCLITWWRLNFYRGQMSSRTARVHRAFIVLLFIEALALCVGFLVDFMRNMTVWIKVLPISGFALTVSFQATPLRALVPIIQGLAMLFLVPYFRKEIFSLLRRSRGLETMATTSSSNDTTRK